MSEIQRTFFAAIEQPQIEGVKITFACGVCGKSVTGYRANYKPTKSGIWCCSIKCAAIGRRRVLSLANGGDGILRSKKQKDAIHYRKNVKKIRDHARAKHHETKEQTSAQKKAKLRALKSEVMDAYGGKCACCGESTLEFLTIDHVNGDGYKHRQEVGKGKNIYADIKRQGFPQDGRFQVLCFNCNIALGFYGYCPHRPEIRREFRGMPKNPGRKRTVE